MTGKMKKCIAFMLALVLMVSPLSQTRVYAAEMQESPTADDTKESENPADEESERASETESGTKDAVTQEPETNTEPQSSAQDTAEEESPAEVVSEEESVTEAASEPETVSEAVSEEESASLTESESGSEMETESVLETESLEDNGAGEEIEYAHPEALEPENVPYDENQDAFTDKLVNSRKARSAIPAKYDAREEGYLPAIRNQGSWGACWSFSLLGAMEVAAVRDLGVSAGSIDLSERHLAYFGYHTGYDALDNANGDTMTSNPAEYYLKQGGNDIRGVVRLMNWNGGADEKEYPYSTSSLPGALDRTAAQDARLYLENAYRYDFKAEGNKSEAIKVVKKMIMDYGAVSWSYYNDSKYVNASNGAYYNNVGGSGKAVTNHAIMAVGWDDSYQKENFREDNQPENDGAWIIRNSWGESNGDDGYYYISYEDKSLGSGNPVYAFSVCDTEKYDNNYFYGNTAYSGSTIAARRAAQVYQIKSENASREKLTAVSFLSGTADVDYELQLYKNPDMENGVVTNPTSGTALLDTPQKGTTDYAGLYTIELASPVILDTEDYVSIVLTFPNTRPALYFDRSYTSDDGNCKGEHIVAKGQSFYGSSLTSWQDNYDNNRTFRINAFTLDCEDVPPEVVKIDRIEYDYANTAVITWSGGAGADKVAIYRSENPSDEGELIADVRVNSDEETFHYQDSVHKGKTYYYNLVPILINKKGTEVRGQTTKSDEILTFPEAVMLETAQYAEGTGVSLTWNLAKGAEGYRIERSDNGGDFAELTTVEDSAVVTYTDSSVQGGNRYGYRVLCYYTAEDQGRAVVSPLNERNVEILPEPVKISGITELKRENNTTRVSLSWNRVENAQSYAVYRSVAADGYVCIAENITDVQYVDDAVSPDTSYSYKVIVTVNGLSSESGKTQEAVILTKPVLTALRMPVSELELNKDNAQEFKITPVPENYPYEKELVWSAFDEDGNPLEVVQKNDTIVINGTDGREVLHLSGNKIYAARQSDTVNITLRAQIDNISAECGIFVYSNDFWVSGVKNLTYTGARLTQDIRVYDGKKLLTEGIDYTVSYRNNINVSQKETSDAKKPAVIIRGKGSYSGTQTIYFEILPEPVSDADKRSILKAKVKSIKIFEYEGTAVTPKPVVTDGKKTLVEGTDYRLTYKNNRSAGKAEVIISGINAYKGTRSEAFTINCNLAKEGMVRVALDTRDVPYAKGGAKPTLRVYCGNRLLREGTDYRLTYKNNKAVASASASKAPTAVLLGKGFYKGKKEISFNIVQQDIGELTLTAKDKVYTGKAGKNTTSFVITDKDGKNLSAGRDYDRTSVVYTYAETGEPVGDADILERGTRVRITVKAAQKGFYSGTISGEYRVASYDIAKARVTVEAQTYTGSAVEPDSGTGVKVTYRGQSGTLTEGVDYIITGYENNINKGTAKLRIVGIGDYCGTKTASFKIKTKIFRWW